MKKLLILTIFFISNYGFGQKAKLDRDTIRYNNSTYFVGKNVELLSGSNANHYFVSVYFGSGFAGLSPLNPSSAKHIIRIDKVFEKGGNVFARGTFAESKAGGNKIFIDITGAVDKKEINVD